MDGLTSDLREKIQPFFKVDRMATQDLLNDIQRAFVKYKANQSYMSNDRTSETLVAFIIKEGVDERLWTEDFSPSESGGFLKYLITRIKNEKQVFRRREKLDNQSEMVNKYIENTIAMNQNMNNEDE